MEKTIKNSIIRKIALCLATVFLLNGCHKEDFSKCGLILSIFYDYNMDYINKMGEELNNIDIFIFDHATGALVRHIEITDPSQLTNNFKIKIDGLDRGVFDIIVWGNLNNSYYDFSGRNSREINQTNLKSNSQKVVETLPGTLFHGMNTQLTVTRIDNNIAEVSLIKNTNNINLTTVGIPMTFPEGGGEPDFIIRIESVNPSYDAFNKLLNPKTDVVTYIPQLTVLPETNDLPSQLTKFNILRLLPNGKADGGIAGGSQDRLIIYYKRPNSVGGYDLIEIYNESLIDVINQQMGNQDFDRQDIYNITLTFDITFTTGRIIIQGWGEILVPEHVLG